MRTTLTIDDDVAVQLDRLRRAKDVGLKELINDALRRGLRDLNAPQKRKPFRTKPYNAGSCLRPTSTTLLKLSPCWKATSTSDTDRCKYLDLREDR